jgi:hypothetical protein
MSFPEYTQGPAKLANSYDLDRDAEGITNPNLHRRIDPELSELDNEGPTSSSYELAIYSTNSYRITKHTIDESNELEIP